MFVRETENSPKEMYYADSLLTKPTSAQSAFSNVLGGFTSAGAFVGDIDQMLNQRPEGNVMRDVADSVQIMNETPNTGWFQGAANELSSMIGYGLNPITWGFGKLGTIAAEQLIGQAARVTPEAASIFLRKPIAEVLGEPLGKYVPATKVAGQEVPLSTALLGEKYAKAFGTFAGAGIPQAWYDSFNADTKHIDWGGAARDIGHMGAFGLAVESIPFAWGILKGRVNRSVGKDAGDAVKPEDYERAFEEGVINKDEYEWIKDYTQNPLEAKNLKERATQILANDGQNVNTATHEVPFEILPRTDVESLKSAVLDQSLSDMPDPFKESVSDYVIHNSIDRLRENPESLDGLRGFKDHIKQKLDAKASKLAEADAILDEHLTKGVKENMSLSQDELVKAAKRNGITGEQIKNLPITVPENVAQHIKQLDEIDRLEKLNKRLFKDFEKSGEQKFVDRMKANDQRMLELKKNSKPLLSPKEELENIRRKLIGESKTYYRGVSDYTFGYKSLEESGETEESLRKNDLWLGKGYWYAENKYHAGKYGNIIQKTKGHFKIFDVENSKDKELMGLYNKVKHSPRIDLIPDLTGKNKIVEKFRDAVKSKGYDGIRRFGVVGKDAAEYEVMFFKKPKEFVQKGLPKNWQQSKEYHRLVDLSNVWENAKSLLDRVNLEGQYERQEAYHNLADEVLRMADSDVGRFANRDNVNNYMRNRIASKIYKREPIEGIEERVKNQNEVPANSEEVLSQNDTQVRQSGADDLSKEFSQVSERYKEFKNNQNVFKNLVQCVLGAING